MLTKDLLETIQKVMPAVDGKSIVAQTDHLIFNGGFLSAYNGRISISTPIDVDIEGSVPANDFLKVVKSIEDKEVDLSVEDGILHVVSKSVRAAISTEVEEEAALTAIRNFNLDPLYDGESSKVSEDFIDALLMCRSSASRNADALQNLNCVCIDCIHVMAGDGYQATIWELEDSMQKVLIPLSAVNDLINFNPVEYFIENGWIHMIDNDDTTFSARIIDGTFPAMKEVVDAFAGEVELVLPDRMAEVAKIFGDIAESPVENFKIIEVNILENQIECHVEKNGVSATKTIPFEGNDTDASFMISSVMLHNILTKTNKMKVGETQALFAGENFKHLIILVQP